MGPYYLRESSMNICPYQELLSPKVRHFFLAGTFSVAQTLDDVRILNFDGNSLNQVL